MKVSHNIKSKKMHADEISIDVPLVRQLLSAQFPQWTELPLKAVEPTGTDNAIYRLGNDMVVRLPRIKKAAEHIDKEYEWLPKLAPQLPLAIPTPIAKGKLTEDYPWQWSIYKWLQGKNATVVLITDLHQAAIDLGNFVVALQKVDAINGPACSRGLPLVSRDRETREAIKLLEGAIDAEVAMNIWEESLRVSQWQGKSVWIHGDLILSNMLTRQGRLSAIIDFGSAGVGDPAADMMVAWTVLDADTREVFKDIVQLDDATWARGRGWALTFGVVALPYYKNSNPVLAAIARRAIDEVLADYQRRDEQ